MSVILSNFNHERWMVTATSIAAQRLVVEECFKFVSNSASKLNVLFLSGLQMGNSAYCLWKTSGFSACHQVQIC